MKKAENVLMTTLDAIISILVLILLAVSFVIFVAGSFVAAVIIAPVMTILSAIDSGKSVSQSLIDLVSSYLSRIKNNIGDIVSE